MNHCVINNQTVKTSKQLHVAFKTSIFRLEMETKSQKKKKIELCQTITNPLGDPYYDFVKDVLIENLLSEIEHEVHWRLLRIPESDEPQIANLIEAKSGKKLGSKHLPFCRCQKCQQNLTGNFNLMKKLRWQNKSPYQGTVFENHRKSLIQHCERSELRLHFEWTKVHQNMPKWSILASF